MYIIWFLHRVPKEREDDFRTVVHAAIEVFRRHGAIGGTVFEMADPTAKYGCSAIETSLEVRADEVLYAELAYFHDRAHYDEVMPKVDADPELADLYQVLIKTVDIGRVVRAEFSTLFDLFNEDELTRYQNASREQWAPART